LVAAKRVCLLALFREASDFPFKPFFLRVVQGGSTSEAFNYLFQTTALVITFFDAVF